MPQPTELHYSIYYSNDSLSLACEIAAIPAPYDVMWQYNRTDLFQQSDSINGTGGGCQRRLTATRYLSWTSGASLDDRKVAAQHSLMCSGDNIYGHINETVTLDVHCKYTNTHDFQ